MSARISYPPFSLRYLRLLSDDTGVIQHALYGVPNRPTGYTTDDNARALLVAAQEFERSGDQEARRWTAIYLAYLYHALTPDNYFHNLMSYDRRWMDARGSEDSHGRALWATGYVATSGVPILFRRAAKQLFLDAVPWARRLRSLRSIAYSLQGICSFSREEPNEPAIAGLAERLADQLCTAYQRNRASDWEWFEQTLTYSNAIMPNALLQAYILTGKAQYRDVAETTLAFLMRHTIVKGVLQPIGSRGWYERSGARAWFDQQPVDVLGMVLVFLTAWHSFDSDEYRDLAQLSFDWFFGKNILELNMVDNETGGCFDGILPEGANGNQGAESQTAYLLSYLAMMQAGLVETTEAAS